MKAENRLNLHTFARIFKDKLKVPNALYFDGKVSKLYSKELDQHDFGWPIGPIVAVVRSEIKPSAPHSDENLMLNDWFCRALNSDLYLTRL